MTGRLAMTMAFAAMLVAMPVDAYAKKVATAKARTPAVMEFTRLTGPEAPARSRFMLIDDLPESYGTDPGGIKVRWKVNKVKVKVPFALSY